MVNNWKRSLRTSVGGLALLLAACGSGGDSDAASAAEATTAAPTTAAPTTTAAETSTVAVTEEEPTEEETESDSAMPATFDADATPLTVEFQFVDEGTYRVDAIGTPLSFVVDQPLYVQPNADGMFVLSHPNSQQPDDRDIVFLRVSDVADPTQPAAAVDVQTAWPADDIEGWLDAVGDEIVVSNRTATMVGGREALQFDLQLADDAECGESFFCVGFITNREVNGKALELRSVYRVLWIDEGDESPIAIVVGVRNESELGWFDNAESILDSLAFGETAPNPIPAEGELWTLGLPSSVPAGVVELPALGGIRFELAEEQFIFQNKDEHHFVALGEVPADSELLLIDRNGDGDPISTADEAVAELTDSGVELTELESITVAGFPTRVFDLTTESFPDGPTFTPVRGELGQTGWSAPTDGRIWLFESDRGLALITAETFDSTEHLAAVIEQSTLIVSTLEFIELG